MITPATSEQNRRFATDIFLLQGESKAEAANYAGVQPSALSHWLKGKPSIAPDKLNQILSFIGLKAQDQAIVYRDNQELLHPRIWRTEDSVMDSTVRCIERARLQYGAIEYAIPKDVRGTAILFSTDGRWGAVQRCNPILLIGHKDRSASVGPGVIQQILDGDIVAFIESVKILSLTGRVDLASLDAACSINELIGSKSDSGANLGDQNVDDIQSQIAAVLAQWGDFMIFAASSHLSPYKTKMIINRFLSMSRADQDAFLKRR